jgi:molybdenum cofactor synthesis domain-containing protein
MAKVFHILMTPKKAQGILTSRFRKLIRMESVDIADAAGSVSADDVYSLQDVPPFDRSEVDGYAVYHKSVVGSEEDSPTELEVVGEIEIGSNPNIEIGEGETVYISTGSVVPRGADAVVMVEYTSRAQDMVKVFKSVSPGENIAHAGSDFFVGEVLLRKDEIVTPERVALLASSGIGKILVYKKMRIGIVSTGNELVIPGNEITIGQIYDSNAYYFKSALDGTGLAECRMMGILPDDRSSMKEFIGNSSGKFDIIVSSGSTSAGFHDLLYRVIEDLGGKMLFHGISIKPGKPTFAASLGNCIFLGMPGFPLSAGSILRYVVVPALRAAYNQVKEEEKLLPLPFRINSEKGKELVLPAIVSRSGRAYPIFGESGSISRLTYADGFIVLRSSKNFYDRDEMAPFLSMTVKKREILFIGSNDPLMERVLFDASRSPTIINAGSWGGVEAIRLGEADVSGIHLLREGIYNIFLKKEDRNGKYVMLRGYSRSQGFVSRDGISSFSQVFERNLVFVNRNKGSGTRDLIESEMERELGSDFEKEKIRGYFWEAKSHAAVAKAIQQGRADAGVSIEFYANTLNLRFHKIRDENYDILLQEDFYRSRAGKRLVSKLKASSKYSKEFPGYKFPKNIGEIIP